MTIRDAFRLRSTAAALTLAGCLPALAALAALPAPAHAGPTHGPAHSSGGAGPFRLSGAGGETPQYRAKTVQICFNTWGTDLEKGYTVGIYKSTWSGRRKVWGARFHGPKNRTCSPWKHSGGETWAQLGSLSSVTGDFWIYWT